MITLLIGENSFEIERALSEITNDFAGNVERIDGSDLQLAQLPDILMGVSLFSTARTVIVRNLSSNKSIWPIFGNWITQLSPDIHLVLVEPKPDKRTSTFKMLKEHASIKEFKPWNEYDIAKSEKWVASEAKKQGIELNTKCIQLLVQRVGVDQWQLFHAIEKLALIDVISIDSIKDIIEANPIDNVFNLFESALRGDIDGLKRTLQSLEKSEDVYRLSSLLFTQVFQLAVIASAQSAVQRTDDISKDFGIHPYVVSKLTPIARRIGKVGVSKIVVIFAQTDDDMKLSRAEPWLLIERALIKVSKI
jgi:DNA polymerase III delta subunit